MRKLIVLTAITLLLPAVSHAKTLEELLVEKGVITKGEAASATASAPGTVHYAKGVRWEFSDKEVTGQLNTLIRTRYTYTAFDKDDRAAHPSNTSSFDVTHARLIASGTVLDKEFSYFLQGDFVGDKDATNKKTASLKDAYITYHACDWADAAMGQHKTGISRQFNVADQDLQFPDESDVSQFFNLGRQAGAWTTMKVPDMPLTFAAGLYNGLSDGEGINRSGNDPDHVAVLNARYNWGEINPYVESDLDNTEDLAVSTGLGLAFGRSHNNVTGATDAGRGADAKNFELDADFIAKYQGWSFAGEYYYANLDSDALENTIHPNGFYAQGAYMVLPSEFELAARFGYIYCDHGDAGGLCAGNKDVNEVDLAANYYFWGNQLKAQLGWALLNEKPEGDNESRLDTNRIIFQLSGFF